MHTRFEALWVPGAGEDAASAGTTAGEAECRALAERIEVEVRRLEAVFNRHDPASPVAALNRCRSASGTGASGVADDDLWFLLEIGEQFRKATFGYFDLAALSNREALLQATLMNAAEAPFRLLHATHEIELRRGCILDFGGIAKGYALEKVRNILQAAGVENALLNFGDSSVLGMGHHPLGPCWEVAPEGPPPSAPSLNTPQFRDGSPENAAPSLNTPSFRDGTPVFRLRDSAISVSGRDREEREHIVDPHTGRPATTSTSRPAPQTARIAVTGRSALVCEILSTALYAAPKELQNEIIANFEGYTTLAH